MTLRELSASDQIRRSSAGSWAYNQRLADVLDALPRPPSSIPVEQLRSSLGGHSAEIVAKLKVLRQRGLATYDADWQRWSRSSQTSPEQTYIRSYAGVRKPISPPQLAALAEVKRGDVFYKPHFGRVFGVRNDTYEVLERNRLVEVLDEPENPDQRPMCQRHRVVLTDAGLRAMANSRS